MDFKKREQLENVCSCDHLAEDHQLGDGGELSHCQLCGCKKYEKKEAEDVLGGLKSPATRDGE